MPAPAAMSVSQCLLFRILNAAVAQANPYALTPIHMFLCLYSCQANSAPAKATAVWPLGKERLLELSGRLILVTSFKPKAYGLSFALQL